MSGWSLTHPLLFALGAALATIPVVIHWLSRRRTRVVEWAAMHLLLGAHRTSQRRVRLEDLALLAARVLAILLASLFLARPILRSVWGGGLTAAQGVEHVVLLDDSLSMRTVDREGTAFDKARRRLIESCASRAALGRDSMTLLLASRPAAPVFERLPLNDARLDDVLPALERLEPTDGAVDWSQSIEAATRYLDGRTDANAQAVYVVSDFRRVDWQDEDARANDGIALVARAARPTRPWLLCDVGGQQEGNVAVTQVAPEGILVEGVTTRWNVTVWNPNAFPVDDVEVRLTAADGLPVIAELPALPANQSTQIAIPYTFGTGVAADANLAAAADADSNADVDPRRERWERVQVELVTSGADRVNRLAADDVSYYAAQVSRGIPVMIVDGAPAADARRSESYYLQRSLAPDGTTPSGIRPTVVAEGEWEAGDWHATPRAASTDGRPAYQVIMLCNVFQLSDVSVQRLRRWVAAGGGLVLLPGDQVDRETFNERLAKGDAPLAPLELVELTGDPEEQRWTGWSSADDSHPVARLFAGDDTRLGGQVKVFRWWAVRELPSARVVARFADRAPALAERAFGQGRVVMLTTPADADWSDWPADPSYVVFFQELVAYLAQSQQSPSAIRAGHVLQSRQQASEFKPGVVLRTPGDRRFELPASPIAERAPDPSSSARGSGKQGGDRDGDSASRDSASDDARDAQWQVQSTETWQAGFYGLELEGFDGRRVEQLVAVTPETSESDLRRAPIEALLREAGNRDLRALSDAADDWFDSLDSGRESWTWIAWCVLGILTVEQTLAVRIGSRRT